MRDDEHVGARQRLARQRSAGVHGDGEVAGLQGGRRARVRRVLRMAGLDGAGDLGTDRPRLAVGFVEQHAGNLGHAQDGSRAR